MERSNNGSSQRTCQNACVMEIDGRWYGEVPRTYFYDRKHQREVKTGLINKKFFEDWLARNAVSGPGS